LEKQSDSAKRREGEFQLALVCCVCHSAVSAAEPRIAIIDTQRSTCDTWCKACYLVMLMAARTAIEAFSEAD